jgi:hypothetical protein
MASGEKRRQAVALHAKARRVFVDTWQSEANLSLFLVMIVLFSFVLPVLGFGREHIRLYSDAIFSVMTISGVAVGWGRPRLMLVAGLIGAVAIAVRWIDDFAPSPTMQLWSDATSIAAIIAIAIVLLAQVFRPGRVSSARVQGAIAVYLILGAGWAHAYHIVDVVQPGSFNSAAGPLSNASDWIYYSFVTLSTVGYGDITAARPIARVLSIGEALSGQLYLAVLIARLVAMEVISWQESQARND